MLSLKYSVWLKQWSLRRKRKTIMPENRTGTKRERNGKKRRRKTKHEANGRRRAIVLSVHAHKSRQHSISFPGLKGRLWNSYLFYLIWLTNGRSCAWTQSLSVACLTNITRSIKFLRDFYFADWWFFEVCGNKFSPLELTDFSTGN